MEDQVVEVSAKAIETVKKLHESIKTMEEDKADLTAKLRHLANHHDYLSEFEYNCQRYDITMKIERLALAIYDFKQDLNVAISHL